MKREVLRSGKMGQIVASEVLEPTIGAMWAAFRAEVLEPSGITGGLQLQETRRTFYTACRSMMGLMCQISEQLSESEACEVLAAMDAESMAFMDKVMAGEPGY